MKIGIGITTHNRQTVCRETFSAFEKFALNVKCSLVVVDDASTPPPFGYGHHYNYYRFEKHVGIGVAKNKCLELLHDEGCTHFFLFDDDCRPLVDRWWEPYVNSGLNHACWNYDRSVVPASICGFVSDDYVQYEKPNGCMLYFTRNCLDTAGGWDLDFKGFGYEHVSLSDRIYNLGLTPARYIDIPNSKGLFELADCESSFSCEVRANTIPTNLHLYQQKFYSKEFKPFK